MPLIVLDPTADSGTPEWTPVGAASNWEAVADDTDGKYNQSGLTSDVDRFVMEDLPGGASTVLDVTLVFRAWHSKTTGTATFNPLWKVGGDETTGPPIYVTNSAQTFRLYGVACPDGGAWSVAKVNALLVGYQTLLPPTAGYVRIGWLEAHVTYDETSLLIDVPQGDVSLTRTAAADLSVTRTAAADVFLER